ncbi:helix-turn-helix transcriptional regulator [Paenibacillus wenxiniae]|uniref:Helix-turn-helix transcriptional regulator n=1 Tax=Paenibacillus wenxiniae TaxID=1636843 RepID=A0ABW4RRR3_9BACL
MKQQYRELGDFLKRKRNSLSPEQLGIMDKRTRRVAGLRREEVADLANISIDWYVRLEQGRAVHPSPEVLASLAHALQLNMQEQQYLFSLAQHRWPETVPMLDGVSERMQRFLDVQLPHPAYVMDYYWTIIAWNRAASVVFGNYNKMSPLERNSIWRAFTDPSMKDLLEDWESHAKLRVSQLRMRLGQCPNDPNGLRLVEQLIEQSYEFKNWWLQGNVSGTPEGSKRIFHPLVGEIRLDYLSFQCEDVPQASITIHMLTGSTSKQKVERLLND